MGYEVQTYNDQEDLFIQYQYSAIPEALERNDYIILLFPGNKFLFSHNKETKKLDIQYEGDSKEFLIIDMYKNQYINGADMEVFKEVFSSLIEGLVMVHAKLSAYFIDNQEEAMKLYNSFYVFKTKAEKEKGKDSVRNVEIVYIPHKDYHDHQLKNFEKKFNLDLKDYTRRVSFMEEYKDMLLLYKGDLKIPASNIFEFIVETKTNEDFIEAKCGNHHLYIYKFNPEKYSKLLRIK